VGTQNREDSSVLPSLHIGRQLVFWMTIAIAYAASVTLIVDRMAITSWDCGREIATVLGLSLGVLLVFRINTANDRWWEARKLWGQLINDLRNLALKTRAHLELTQAERHHFSNLLAGFANSLRLHLRGQNDTLPGLETQKDKRRHLPGFVAELIHQAMATWNREGKLMQETLWVLDVHARSLMDICGACERIRNTPTPSSYRALLRGAIAINIATAPWVVATEMGWWGLPVFAIGIGFLLGIELTAESIEEPFGGDGDDLPLRTYCQSIETFVRATLEDTAPNSMETAR
jgi:putative membrane protein